MPIINLRKYYYPTIRKDAFVEVSGEVAEALEEGLRIERRQEKKKLYHKGPPAQGQQQNNRSEHCKRAATDISSVAALLYLKYDI